MRVSLSLGRLVELARGGPEIATDARPALDHPRRRDPERERRQRLARRSLRGALALVVGLEVVNAYLGDGGWREWERLAHEAALRRAQVAEQRARVEALAREVGELRTSAYARERIAREQLELAAPGEITFLLPATPESAPPAVP